MNKKDTETPKLAENLPALPEPLYGKCNGRFSFLRLTTDFAENLLPPDLELAPQPYTQPGMHPVMLMYNDTWLHSNSFLEKTSNINSI